MKVDRFNPKVQEELQSASNYNSLKVDNLFSSEQLNVQDNSLFSSLKIEDLNVTEDKIAVLFGNFTNEVVKAFTAQSQSSNNPYELEMDEYNPFYIA